MALPLNAKLGCVSLRDDRMCVCMMRHGELKRVERQIGEWQMRSYFIICMCEAFKNDILETGAVDRNLFIRLSTRSCMNPTPDIEYRQQQEARPDVGNQMLPLPNVEDICLWVSGHRGHLNTRIGFCLPGECWSLLSKHDLQSQQRSSRFQAYCLQQTLEGQWQPSG